MRSYGRTLRLIAYGSGTILGAAAPAAGQIAACCNGTTCSETLEGDCTGYWLANLPVPVVACVGDPCALGACCSGAPVLICDDDEGNGVSEATCNAASGSYVGGALCTHDAAPCVACPGADEDHCQLLDTGIGFIQRCDSRVGQDYRCADDFRAAETGVLDQVCWWPAFAPPAGFPECSDPADTPPDSFTLHVYEDLGNIPDMGAEVTPPGGLPLNVDLKAPVLGRLWQYSATVGDPGDPAVQLTAGECYWLEINAIGTATCNIFWGEASKGNDHSMHDFNLPDYPNYTTEDAINADLAWCLSIQIGQTPPLEAGCDTEVLGGCCLCPLLGTGDPATCQVATKDECVALSDPNGGVGNWKIRYKCANTDTVCKYDRFGNDDCPPGEGDCVVDTTQCDPNPCQGQPANDLCENAIPITHPDGDSSAVITTFYNVFCSDSEQPPTNCAIAGGDLSFGVWFEYQTRACGSVRVESCASTPVFDGFGAIYRKGDFTPGNECAEIAATPNSEAACNDDGCGASGPWSYTINVDENETFYIRVGSWWDGDPANIPRARDSGLFELTFTEGGEVDPNNPHCAGGGEDCWNGFDDDGDGCSDGADSDCGGTETSCYDALDNDCDGATDWTDSDCCEASCCPHADLTDRYYSYCSLDPGGTPCYSSFDCPSGQECVACFGPPNGRIDFYDYFYVSTQIAGTIGYTRCGAQDPDVNCDGVINRCDLDGVLCGVGATGGYPGMPVPEECFERPCGGCCVAGTGCVRATQFDCEQNLSGTYLGDDAACIPSPCDCDGDGVLDRCAIDCGLPGCNVPGCGVDDDSNVNGTPDECEGELIVDSIAVSGAGLAGRAVHVAWDVRNANVEDTVRYSFFDVVYLSSDDTWDIGDIRLGSVLHDQPIAPQQGYHAETDVVLPGVLPGPNYILVRTDHGHSPEGHTASAEIFVDIEELTLGVAAADEFTDAERARYYRVTVAEGEDLRISLDDLDDVGANELYVRREAVPNRSQFDYRYTANFAGDQAVRIPGTAAGTYYVLGYAQQIPAGSAASFNLLAEYLPLQVTSITPDHGGNTGQVTVQLLGARFTPEPVVRLIGIGGEVRDATEAYFEDATKTHATFDLTGASAGAYDLFVDNNAGAAFLLQGAFQVEDGGGPILLQLLTIPSVTRVGRRAVFYAELTNSGTVDSFVPLVWLELPDGVQVTLDADRWPETQERLLLDFTPLGNPNLPMAPGTSVTIPVYYLVSTVGWKLFSLDVYDCPAHVTEQVGFAYQLNPDDVATHTDPLQPGTQPLRNPHTGQNEWKESNCTFTLGAVGPSFPTTPNLVFSTELDAAFASDWDIGYRSDLQPDPSGANTTFFLWRGTHKSKTPVAGAYLFLDDIRPWIQVVAHGFGEVVDYVGSSDDLPFYFDKTTAASRPEGLGELRAAKFVDAPLFGTSYAANQAIRSKSSYSYPFIGFTHASRWTPPFDQSPEPVAVANQGVSWGYFLTATWNDPNNGGGGGTTGTGSTDPNLKIGPRGYGDLAFVPDDASMPYTILFENVDTATAAAVEVRVTDQLDPSLDYTTLTLDEIGFGETVIRVPDGLSHYQGRVEVDGWTWSGAEGWHRYDGGSPLVPLIVDVEAGINAETGEVYWNLRCADRNTGNFPMDGYAGFLPPDREEIAYPHPENPTMTVYPGEGYVTYRVRPRSGLATGTETRNKATIIFDQNEPIDTPETLNTIDSGAATSSVTPLPPDTMEPSFTVAWTGQDDVGGSGIARYEVYVGVDGGPFTLWRSTADASAVYNGEIGHSYAFYSVARDNVGNREAPPGVSDTTIAVLSANQPPEVGPVTARVDPVAVGTAVNAQADFTDPNLSDTHTAVWDWGDGTSSVGTITEAGGSGSVSDSHIYAAAGIYTITVTVTDDNGESDQGVFEYVVVYDPSGGFVTGGGWIDSLEGAFAPDPSLTGRATFGFVSRYQRGATVPTGQTEFQFKVADLNFHSSSYQWLVVSGPKGQFKGSGTVNGEGDYGFMLTAVDGQLQGGGGADKFRMKIWTKIGDLVVYDNQINGDDNAIPATAIGGGSIVIHP